MAGALMELETMGVDWSAFFSALAPAATAQGLAAALTPITGSMPIVANRGSYYEVSFTPDQETRLVEWILTQLRREPGPVRFQAGGVALRVVARQYWPYAVGLAVAGVAVGYALKGAR